MKKYDERNYQNLETFDRFLRKNCKRYYNDISPYLEELEESYGASAFAEYELSPFSTISGRPETISFEVEHKFFDEDDNQLPDDAAEDHFYAETVYIFEEPEAVRVSLDGGISFCSPEKVVSTLSWETIVAAMDENVLESVNNLITTSNHVTLLKEYLLIATDDLIFDGK